MNTRFLGGAVAIAIMVSAPIIYLGCMAPPRPGQSQPTVSSPSASSTSSAMPSALPAPTDPQRGY
jgi:hypothetical protein